MQNVLPNIFLLFCCLSKLDEPIPWCFKWRNVLCRFNRINNQAHVSSTWHVLLLEAIYLLGSPEFLMRGGVAARAGFSSRTRTGGSKLARRRDAGRDSGEPSLTKCNSATGTHHTSQLPPDAAKQTQNYGVWERIDDQSHSMVLFTKDLEYLAASFLTDRSQPRTSSQDCVNFCL